MDNVFSKLTQQNEFIHGGDIYSEGLLKGRDLIDFSSNINPLGVPTSFSLHVNEGIEKLNQYPDIKYRELKSNLLNYINCDSLYENNIILGNGAAEIIDLVISCFNSILIVVPSFVEYDLNAQKWGCKVEYSMLKEDMTLYYEDIFSKINHCDSVIIGNPNNPNGGTVDKDKLMKILDFAETNNKTVIIDEAFIEFSGIDNYSFQNEIKNYKCIFIIRAITKFFSLPGIRFGYGISDNVNLLNKMREKQNPWNINCFAEVAVKYVLKDIEYISNSLKWIEEEVIYFPEKLKKVSFIEKVYNTKANFVLCKLKGIDAYKLYDFCLDKGIIIRKASNFIGLNDRYVRFAIKDRYNNDLLIHILEEAAAKVL